VNFSQFLTAAHILRVICDIDQENLRMKFPALTADLCSPRANPVDSRRPAHASIKEGHPSKSWLFYRYWRV